MSQTIIIGSGMAGLLAACKFPGAKIYDKEAPQVRHRALLRFRDTSVSELTGIPFKKVTIQKGVYQDGKLITGSCGFDLQNRYAMKVTNHLVARSINDLSPSVRYIAPDDFHQQLIDRFQHRIMGGFPMDKVWMDNIRECGFEKKMSIINTAPMPVMLEACGIETEFNFETSMSSINVDRFEINIDVCDLHQTVYYPDPRTDVYRASITGRTLIIESLPRIDDNIGLEEIKMVCESFGIHHSWLNYDTCEHTQQKYGKISGLPMEERERLMYLMTSEFSVFSVGRFACWREGLLLDDVAKDLGKVERLISVSDYRRNLMA